MKKKTQYCRIKSNVPMLPRAGRCDVCGNALGYVGECTGLNRLHALYYVNLAPCENNSKKQRRLSEEQYAFVINTHILGPYSELHGLEPTGKRLDAEQLNLGTLKKLMELSEPFKRNRPTMYLNVLLREKLELVRAGKTHKSLVEKLEHMRQVTAG